MLTSCASSAGGSCRLLGSGRPRRLRCREQAELTEDGGDIIVVRTAADERSVEFEHEYSTVGEWPPALGVDNGEVLLEHGHIAGLATRPRFEPYVLELAQRRVDE